MALSRPDACRGCLLDDLATGFSRPEGQGTLKVALIGEALGDTEAAEGLPFRPTAPAGSVLERAIRLTGLSRAQFALTNIASCQPPRNFFEGARWEHGAAEHCKVHRDAFMARFQPKVIVALGNVPLKHLTEMSGRAKEDQSITDLRGYPLPARDYPGVWVLPAYHPSFLRRGKKAGQDGGMGLLGTLIHDLLKAVQIARHGHTILPTQYQEHPSLDDARAFLGRARAEQGRLLTYDIETPNSRKLAEDERENDPSYEILSVQFSLSPQTGIFLPWVPGFTEIARAILALPNPKLGANVWAYDNPRLRAQGCEIAGRVDDLQWAFHHLQSDLRCGLQTVVSFYGGDAPWKHIKNAFPEFYGIADVDYPQRAWPAITEALAKKGLWRGYDDLVRGFQPVLADMTRRGIPVDDAARLTLQAALVEERDREGEAMQALVPDSLRNVHPKAGYKKVPKSTEGLVERAFPDGGVRWCRILPFLPNSSQQILRYIKAQGHPVPKNFKTLEDTTEAEELRRLGAKTGDPIYAKILAYRKAAKAISTYTTGWAPDPRDGCVHPQFGFRPATGQTSSNGPNAQNMIRKGPLAAKMGAMIAAQPGRTLVKFDFKSFHALTLGFEAQDPDYMRAARLDIHSLVSGEVLKVHRAEQLWAKSDGELRDYFSWYKSDPARKAHRDNKAKPAILGIGFGLGVRKLYQMNLDSFDSEMDARRVRATILGLFPRVFAYQDRIRKLAHSQGYLISRWGFIRWFWEVMRYDPRKWNSGGTRGDWVPGEDSEAAIAFLPANDAFGHIRTNMVTLRAQGLDEQYGLMNNVHDDLRFHAPDQWVEECVHRVGEIMRAPSAMLMDPVVAPRGLICDVEVSVGPHLAAMHTVEAGEGALLAAR